MKNALAASGRSLKEGWPMSSLNADRAIGLDSTKGSLKVGKDADLVLVDESFQVLLTVVEGDIVVQKSE